MHTLIEGLADKFINDLTESINAVKAYPKDKKASSNVKVYGAVGMMPTEVQKEVCLQYQKERLSFKPSIKLGLFSNSAVVEKEALINEDQLSQTH